MSKSIFISLILLSFTSVLHAADIKIGLNYPETGPYAIQGLAQLRAAKMAVDEINSSGGILHRKIVLIERDTKSKADLSKLNVENMIDYHGCEMIFGGSSSAVAIAGGKAAKSRGKLYFGTLTYSNATTGKAGHKYIFRECYNSWMAASVLSDYLKIYYNNKKYFFITADYTWGWTTEDSIRTFSGTMDKKVHKGVRTPFPGATEKDFFGALSKANVSGADVLVLVLFGNDMARAVKIATRLGLKQKMGIVVPNITLGMAESAGPEVMAGVVGALPWSWKIPYIFNIRRGKAFVEKFAEKYEAYPSTSAASAYTILYQYKYAAERAGTLNTKKIIEQLEGFKFQMLKNEQIWRKFDHQCIQTVYAVKCKPAKIVRKDKYKQDYFQIMRQMPGDKAARDYSMWKQIRLKAKTPVELEW